MSYTRVSGIRDQESEDRDQWRRRFRRRRLGDGHVFRGTTLLLHLSPYPVTFQLDRFPALNARPLNAPAPLIPVLCLLIPELVEGEGFEPSKAEPTDLQSVPFDRSGTPPTKHEIVAAWLDGRQTRILMRIRASVLDQSLRFSHLRHPNSGEPQQAEAG